MTASTRKGFVLDVAAFAVAGFLSATGFWSGANPCGFPHLLSYAVFCPIKRTETPLRAGGPCLPLGGRGKGPICGKTPEISLIPGVIQVKSAVKSQKPHKNPRNLLDFGGFPGAEDGT